MAAPLHKKMRNVLRSHRYNDPSIPLDDDVLETLKLWKWGADEPPQFYDDSITEGGGEVGVVLNPGSYIHGPPAWGPQSAEQPAQENGPSAHQLRFSPAGVTRSCAALRHTRVSPLHVPS